MGGGEEDNPGEEAVRIVILRSAIEDLIQGQAFYERQGECRRSEVRARDPNRSGIASRWRAKLR